MEPAVQSYMDYRIYLQDFYQFKKGQKSSYSYRVFANKGGLGSPSHLKMVIDGKRNLSIASIARYKSALGIKGKDNEYFEQLVFFTQSQDLEEKNRLFNRLITLRSGVALGKLDLSQYEFLSQWFNVAIYVMLGISDFRATVDNIGMRLRYKVSPKEIAQSIELLIKLGLVTMVEKDQYRQVNGALGTDDRVRGMAIFKYHQQMLELAKSSLRYDSLEEREFAGVTISVSQKDLPTFKEKVRAFRKEMNELATMLKGEEEIYQINIQLFPLSRKLQ